MSVFLHSIGSILKYMVNDFIKYLKCFYGWIFLSLSFTFLFWRYNKINVHSLVGLLLFDIFFIYMLWCGSNLLKLFKELRTTKQFVERIKNFRNN